MEEVILGIQLLVLISELTTPFAELVDGLLHLAAFILLQALSIAARSCGH